MSAFGEQHYQAWSADDGGIPDGIQQFWEHLRAADPVHDPGDGDLCILYDGPGTEPDPPAHEDALIGRYDADTDSLTVQLRYSHSHLTTETVQATPMDLDYELETAQQDGYEPRTADFLKEDAFPEG